MTAVLKVILALLTVVLFGFAAVVVVLGAVRLPNFAPNDGQTFMLDTVGAALIAFLAAQLGIAVQVGGNAGAALRRAMSSQSNRATVLLVADAVVFLIVGLAFVFLWLKPDFVAVPEGAPDLTEAPGYIATRAKSFLTVTIAAIASLAPNARIAVTDNRQ
jgi:hypothetical protein